jgi:hypothetical protein
MASNFAFFEMKIASKNFVSAGEYYHKKCGKKWAGDAGAKKQDVPTHHSRQDYSMISMPTPA